MSEYKNRLLFRWTRNISTLVVFITAFLVNGNLIAQGVVKNISASNTFTDADHQIYLPFFPLIYNENGIDQMNINLVDLKLSGLKIGDEIGVFDGNYCVGAIVIEETDMLLNLISIPASANDAPEANPNGFIKGHVIGLKMYRDGIVYDLLFELINNSSALFQPKGSMFALINSLISTSVIAQKNIDFSVYPNPFTESLNIVFDNADFKILNCDIFDSNGKIVKSFINEMLIDKRIIVWDGKNENNVKLIAGNYYLRVNDQVIKVMLIK